MKLTDTIPRAAYRVERDIPHDRWFVGKEQMRTHIMEAAWLYRRNAAIEAELDAVDQQRNALIDLVESQRAELDAFKAAGAASMETYNAKET